jgi:hypothetical protein
MEKQLSDHDVATVNALVRIVWELERTAYCDALISPAKRTLQKLVARAPFDDKKVCRVISSGTDYYPNGLVEESSGYYKIVLAPYPIPGLPGRKLGPEPQPPAVPKPPKKVARKDRCNYTQMGPYIKHVLKYYPTIAIQYYLAKGKKPPNYTGHQNKLISDEQMKSAISFCQMLEGADEDTRSNPEVCDAFITASRRLGNAISARVIRLCDSDAYQRQVQGCIFELTPKAIAMVDKEQKSWRIPSLSYDFDSDVAKACHSRQVVWAYYDSRPGKAISVEHAKKLGAAYATLDALSGPVRDAYVHLGIMQPKEETKATQEA